MYGSMAPGVKAGLGRTEAKALIAGDNIKLTSRNRNFGIG